MSREHLERDVCFVEYQKSRRALLALCEIEHLDEIEDGRLNSCAE